MNVNLPPRLTSPRARVLGLLAVMAALLLSSMARESPTTDEPLHLTRGIAYFWGPDASLSYSHPPLGNAFAAIPIAVTRKHVDLQKLEGFHSGEVWTLANKLLGPHYSKRRAWFFEARAMVAVLALALAYYVYRLGTRLFGAAVGFWALLFVVFHPTIIAHGRLVTTDMPVTLAMVITAGELASFLAGRSRWHGVAAIAAVGVGLVTKYTGLLMVPFTVLAVLATACVRAGRYRDMGWATTIRSAVLFLTLAGFGTLFIINLAYRFERTGMTAAEMLALPEPAPKEPRGFGGAVLETSSILPKLPASMPIPLPYTYVFGLSVLRAHGSDGHPTTFFGELMRHGHPAYFPVMLLIKTPLLLLSALGYAAYVGLRRRGRVSWPALLLAAYMLAMLATAMRASINIGVRHVLPMIPVMALFGGLGVVHALRSFREEQTRKRLTAGIVVVSALGMVWAFPDYLSDFNVLVAGRWGGERVSIVGEEWGQDTLRLGRALREREIDHVFFSGDSFTSKLELRRYGVKSNRLGCPNVLPNNAYVAVQARDLARHREGCMRWAVGREPTFGVNGHVFVYQTGPNEIAF